MHDVKCQKISTTNSDINNEPTTEEIYQIDCPSSYDAEDVNKFIKKIADDYEVQLLIDNLPVASSQAYQDCGNMPGTSYQASQKSIYSRPSGFPLGCMTKNKKFFLNNHWSFTIKYHKDAEKGEFYIVGADVVPSSIDYSKVRFSCNPEEVLPESISFDYRLELKEDTPINQITWSYSLKWEESNIKWASRWDAYANVADTDNAAIHWFTIINALVIVLLLTTMVALILIRAVRKDIKRYQSEDDESGWKLLHGDVFRPPTASGLLSVLYGNGIQLLSMTLITLIFVLFGLNHPENRGYLATLMLILFAIMGILGGHQALRYYKMLDGTSWKLVTVMTALLFPSLTITLFSLGNLVFRILANTSSAVSFLTLLKIFFIWSGVSVPLVFIGGYFGYTQEKISQPSEINSIPRYIPKQPWYFSTIILFLGAGLLPFGAGVMEVYFIMTSIWLHKFYYVFGFLFLAFIIVLLTCAEITIVITYFQLCNENYKWWWRSFLMGGSCAFYLFLYSIFYFLTRIQSRTVLLALLYLEYMSIISWFLFLITGSVGLLGSTLFIRKIYSQIKVN